MVRARVTVRVNTRVQRWSLATESLYQIFISKILIFEIVYENWRILAVNREMNATFMAFLHSAIWTVHNCKTQRNLH